jgi:hypothetical protein
MRLRRRGDHPAHNRISPSRGFLVAVAVIGLLGAHRGENSMAWASALEDHPEHVSAIGMVSIENANLELALADLLSAALSISRRMAHAIYFTPRAASLRVEILQAAVEAKLAPRSKVSPNHAVEIQKRDALKKVKRLLKSSFKVIQRRHAVIHDAWGVTRSDDPPAVIRQKIRSAVFVDAEDAPLSTLRDLIKDIRVLIDDAEQITYAFRKHPPTMADMRIK